MSTTAVAAPTSRVRFGYARVEITPPVGIYHRMWGAARHDRATGVHRPLLGDVMAFGALDDDGVGLIRVELDMVGLDQDRHNDLARHIGESAGVSPDRVIITVSHTHSGGLFRPDRIPLPGGELIPAYLDDLRVKLVAASRAAVANLQPVVITYAVGRCDMAANRDYWDDEREGHVCGYNPDSPADDTVVVGRVTDGDGQIVATFVNYACHPTTLAWDNTLLSPDYVGAMREVVEGATDAPCIFALGACGDQGPRHGFVGDTAVADKNGRQLGYAALSALASMDPPVTAFRYTGPVISGATIGTWAHAPLSGDRLAETARFVGGRYSVDLEVKPRPDRATLEAEMARQEALHAEAAARGDELAARDARARAERARRALGRLNALPDGSTYPYSFAVYRMGDAVWVTVGGEPYNVLQRELRRRFPGRTIIVSPLSGGFGVGYLLPRDRYGRGLYQEDTASLAPGTLETLIDAVAARIAEV